MRNSSEGVAEKRREDEGWKINNGLYFYMTCSITKVRNSYKRKGDTI